MSINTKQKLLRKETTVTQDENGNELKKEEFTQVQVPREPDFVKVYLEGVSKIFALSGGENAFLCEILKLVNYDNEVVINKGIKQKIAKKLGFKEQTIDNNIAKLKKSKIIATTEFRGIYMINPEIFGKGAWLNVYKARAKYQKLTVKLEISNNTKNISDAKFDVELIDDNEKIEEVAKSRNQTVEEFLAELEASSADDELQL